MAINLKPERSISVACQILGISWEAADGIKQRAVIRGLCRKSVRTYQKLCVDEKSFGRGHNYVTLVAHIRPGQSATAEFVGEGRKPESLDAFWETLTPEQLADIQAVAMDMRQDYINSTVEHVPGAEEKIVHYPFHLVRDMNDAVNDVRKQEQKALRKENDSSLDGTRYLWLYGRENLPRRWSARFDAVNLAILLSFGTDPPVSTRQIIEGIRRRAHGGRASSAERRPDTGGTMKLYSSLLVVCFSFGRSPSGAKVGDSVQQVEPKGGALGNGSDGYEQADQLEAPSLGRIGAGGAGSQHPGCKRRGCGTCIGESGVQLQSGQFRYHPADSRVRRHTIRAGAPAERQV